MGEQANEDNIIISLFTGYAHLAALSVDKTAPIQRRITD
jgi:hypothetical protein